MVVPIIPNFKKRFNIYFYSSGCQILVEKFDRNREELEIEEITTKEEDYFRQMLFRSVIMKRQPLLVEKIVNDFLNSVGNLREFKRKLEESLSCLSQLKWPLDEVPGVLFDDVVSKFRTVLKIVNFVAHRR